MLRTVTAGAITLGLLLVPTEAYAAPVSPFSGTVALATVNSIVVAVRNGRRDTKGRTVTVSPAPGAVVKVDGKVVMVSRIPAGARVSVNGGTTTGGAVTATEIIATR